MTGDDPTRRRHTALWLLLGVVVVAAVFVVPALLEHEPPGPPAPPPHRDSPVVVVYGDSQGREKAHARVVEAIRSRAPEVVFHSGDMVHHGDDAGEWQGFLATTAELRREAELFPALGNHEGGAARYFAAFGLSPEQRWYAVERFGIHFLVLDSNSDIGPGSEQYAWLERELSDDGAGFTVVVMHHPPYSTGPMPEDEMGLRSTVVPLFERHRVDLVFSGHDHDYERSEVNGVVYVVSGGAGARLYSRKRSSDHSLRFSRTHHFCELFAADGALTVRAIDADLRLVDRFVVTGR